MAKRGRKKKVVNLKPESTEAALSAVKETAMAEPKHRGRKSQYTEEQKAAFLDAVKNGRNASASWAEIFDAAKTQGFKGSLQYLQKMATTSGVTKKRSRQGRPKGSKNVTKAASQKRVPTRLASKAAGLGDIESIVARMVEEKVSVAIERAVASLERASQELRKL